MVTTPGQGAEAFAEHGPPTLPRYTVREVAERLGIPTATLRSWAQRYGIGPAEHEHGRHRLYSEADLAAVERMLAQVRNGTRPAVAAMSARAPSVAFGDEDAVLAAAFALDSTTVSAVLSAHLRSHGIVDTWERLCMPAFARLVTAQDSGEGCIDVEHLLSWCIGSTLQRMYPPPTVATLPGIVLACTSGEHHALALEALRAGLAERGVAVVMLGPDVPTEAVVDTIMRNEQLTTVLLWAQQETTARLSTVRACVDAGAHVYVGGPGWDAVRLPDGVGTLGSLPGALAELGGPAPSE